MTYTERVLEIIAANPGIHGGDIRRKLNSESNDEFTVTRINGLLGGLTRRQKEVRIENRGGTGVSARWYIAEPLEEPEPSPYLEEAQRILHEMQRIIPKYRVAWLAEQLHALIDH